MAERNVVLVVGGAGFIGSHCCVVLAEKYMVVVIDNLANSSRKAIERVEEITEKKIFFHETDATDEAALDEVVRQYQGRIVAAILLAGLKAVGESVKVPLRYYEINIGAAISVMKVIEKYGCKQIVFSSSATVYGQAKVFPIPETAETCPLNPYGRTKLYIEKIMEDVCEADHEWKAIVLRYFNPCGAHPSGKIGENPQGIPNNLMPYLANVAVGKYEFLTVFGNDYNTSDGTGQRDYIHVMDLAEAHLAAVNKLTEESSESESGYSIYNIGSGTGYTVLEMIAAMSKAAKKEISYKLGARRHGDTDILVADTTKASLHLHFSISRTLDDMCRDLYNWQTQNPDGYAS